MQELNYIITEIRCELEKILNQAGLYYRIFTRQKSDSSLKSKLERKASDYLAKNKKMQDLIGVRIVFYFREDVEIFNSYLHDRPDYLDDSTSEQDIQRAQSLQDQIENLADKMFMPTRLNLVFRMMDSHSESLKRELVGIEDFNTKLIDSTYEIQLRTVLSEGWHEVEHDLRYKSKDEPWWNECEDESRMLNGIYATLETSERALDQIFASIAYKNYKSKDWSAMMRNHLKLHATNNKLSEKITKELDGRNDLAKAIFRVSRREVVSLLLKMDITYPLTMDNLFFLINRITVKDPDIMDLELPVIKSKLNQICSL